jgi:hypothetical protein
MMRQRFGRDPSCKIFNRRADHARDFADLVRGGIAVLAVLDLAQEIFVEPGRLADRLGAFQPLGFPELKHALVKDFTIVRMVGHAANMPHGLCRFTTKCRQITHAAHMP